MDKGGVFGDGACCHHLQRSNKSAIPIQSSISRSVLVPHNQTKDISVFKDFYRTIQIFWDSFI